MVCIYLTVTKIWEFVGVSGKNQWMNEETASDSFL